MSEYRTIKLGDIATITSSKRVFLSDYVAEGVPFYRSKEIIEKSLGQEVSTELFISHAKYSEIKERYGSPSDGDILIAAVGERAGIPYVVNDDGDFYFKDGNLIWLKGFAQSVSSQYLFRYLMSSVGQQQLESTMIGSAQKALTIIGLKHLEVPFPPYSQQLSIAEILSSLDDKIDLLHQQNKTLEQLAETLFRQWFVEEIDDTPSKEVYDFITIDYGFPFDSKLFNEEQEGLPLIRIRDLADGRPSTYTTQAVGEKYIVMDGDLLAGMDGEFRIHIWKGTKALLNQRVCKLRPQNGIPHFWVYNTIMPLLDFYEKTKGGTTVIHLGKSDFDEMRLVNPNDTRLNDYREVTDPLFEKYVLNSKTIRNLENLRDALLPKLISGEVRVASN